ncbi:hypothetical protein [Mycoplasmopsis lipofaciens]|nr:hypothetical protein [Mycoplasmopsis lipofaciens]
MKRNTVIFIVCLIVFVAVAVTASFLTTMLIDWSIAPRLLSPGGK